MSSFPSGVAIVTTLDADGLPYGLTCTSLCSVSVSPPSLLVCLNKSGRSIAAVRGRGAFAVNLLNSSAKTVAETFSSPNRDRFAAVPWEHTSRLRLPRLREHAFALAECTVERCVDAADHVIVFGRVISVQVNYQEPLIYARREYAIWPRSGREAQT